MKQKLIDTILQYNLIQKGDSIVIGLSGGADSVCLTLCLNDIKEEYDLTLKAVHINHKLRGKEADSDMQFCKDFCKKLNIEIECFEIDVCAEAKERKLGFEECARQVRYETFERVANGAKIATAHNLDDVAETLLLNITRGSSIKGIASIPCKRGNIIRPLIVVSRSEIENFLKEKNQKFVTDSTNLCDDYTRNKIRHNVIPVLKEINPEFLESVKRLTKSASMSAEFIEKCALEIADEKVEISDDTDDAVLFEYVSSVLQKHDICADFLHLQECVETIKKDGRCQLPKGYLFESRNKKIRVYKNTSEEIKDFEFVFLNSVKTPYNKYNAKIISYEEFKNNANVYNLFLNNAIDYDKICDSLILRNRRSGDRILLKNRKVNKLLKSVYNELKIPQEARGKLALLLHNDEIIWAEGIGVSHKFCPSNTTKNVLLIESEVDCY